MQRLAFLLLVAFLTFGCSTKTEKSEPAFAPVADDFIEVIALRPEPDESDSEAYDEYWNQRWAVHDVAMEETILADATQEEKDLFAACWQAEYTKARKLADRILKNDPFSLVGLYGIAQVEAYAEGDLPYALSAIRQARIQAEKIGHVNRNDQNGQEWYLRILQSEFEILFAMDRSEEALSTVDIMEAVYNEPLPWLRVWSLAKLKRKEELQTAAEKCFELGVFKDEAENAVAASEDKTHHRFNSVTKARALGERNLNSGIYQYNQGLAEAYAFSFKEAEQALLRSTKATDGAFYGTAFIPLSSLFLQQGRIAEALDALKKAQQQRGQREAHSLEFDEASINGCIATLMLAIGEEDHALKFAQSASTSPDRAGFTSNSQIDLNTTNALVFHSVAKCTLGKLNEQSRIRKLSFAEQRQRAQLYTQLWQTRQMIRSTMNSEYLINLIRPNLPGVPGVETGLQSWQRLGLLDAVPMGVVQEAIDEATLAEQTNEEATPYLKGIQSLVFLKQGNSKAALDAAESSLEQMNPRAEKILRAHIAAIAGQAAWNLNEYQVALNHWEKSLRDFPQAVRLLGQRLPVAISHGDDVHSKLIAKQFRSAFRFRADQNGFPLGIRKVGPQKLLVELFTTKEARLLEFVLPAVGNETPVEIRAARKFHEELFQPLVELTQADLGSLDGSPIAARMRSQVDDLFADFRMPGENQIPDAD